MATISLTTVLICAILLISVIVFLVVKQLNKSKISDNKQTETTQNNLNNTKHCIYCGAEMPVEAKFCGTCGKPFKEEPDGQQMTSQTTVQSQSYQQHHTTVIVQQQTNGVGKAGFIFALFGLFLGWVPAIGWILWFLGTILSFIGLFKAPRGFAVAGLVISFIDIIMLLFLVGGIAALLT